jgi:hypothetical protein
MEEQLTFRFVQRGLSQLRRAFSGVQDDLDEIADESDQSADALGDLSRRAGDSADAISDAIDNAARGIEDFADRTSESAFDASGALDRVAQQDFGPAQQGLSELTAVAQRLSRMDLSELELEQLESSADAATNAVEDLTEATSQMQDDLTDAGRRGERSMEDIEDSARQSASGVERAFDNALADMGGQIEGLQGALSSFTLSDSGINLQGQLGDLSGGIFGDLLTGSAIAANALSNLEQSNISRAIGAEQAELDLRKVTSRADELRQKIEHIQRVAAQSDRGLGSMAQLDLENLNDRYKDVRQELQRTARKAQALGVDLSSIRSPETDAVAADLSEIADEADDAGSAADALKAKVVGLTARFAALSSSAAAAGATIGGTLVVAMGAAILKAQQLAKETGVYAQELKVAEAQSGATAGEIQRVYLAANALDSQVDLDTVRDAFKELALRVQEAREGTGEAREALGRLGISIEDLEDKSTGEVFDLLISKTRDLTAEQRILTMEQIAGGEAGERLARVFSMAEGEFATFASTLAAMGGISADQVDALDDLRSQYTIIDQQVQALKMRYAAELAPVLNNVVIPATKTLLYLLGQTAGVISSAITGIESMTRSLAKYVKEIRYLYMILEAFKTAVPDTDSEGPGTDYTGRGSGARVTPQVPDRPRIREEDIQEAELIEAPDVLRMPNFYELLGADSLRNLSLPEWGGLLTSIKDVDQAMDVLQAAYESADTKKAREEIRDLIKVLEGQKDIMEGEELWEMPTDLQGIPDAVDEAKESLTALERALSQALSRSTQRLFDSFGTMISQSIFGGGGPTVAQAQLDLFGAQQQMRSLRNALAQGEMSYREYSLRVQTAQDAIRQKQEQLNDAMSNSFVSALEDMGDAAKQIFKQLIADITAAIAKMAVLKAVASIFNISSGGFMGSVFSSLGGGGFLNAAAPAPAPTSINVAVQGQTSTAGRDLVTSFNTTQSDKRRLKGPRSPR